MHYVFDTPNDRLVWDVGHQAYAHKILTGRRDELHTIKQYGGLSGFLRRDESEYDTFGAGHASTSISAGLGMAIARDTKGEDFHVCALIGDSSLAGGMAMEAINQAGHLKSRLIVLLNDNEMSIAPAVGALSRYLNRIKEAQSYQHLKEEIGDALESVPGIGGKLRAAAKSVKDAIAAAVLPGALVNELGFKYIGYVDGHNVSMLVRALGLSPQQAGIFLGGTIHDVAQVVGAGYSLSAETGDVATLVKLLRVAMLLPVIVLAAAITRARASAGSDAGAAGERPPLLPGFAVAFALLVAINSTGWVPAAVQAFGNDASRWCLVAAIAGIGMKTQLKELATVGFKPVALMIGETVFLAALALTLMRWWI